MSSWFGVVREFISPIKDLISEKIEDVDKRNEIIAALNERILDLDSQELNAKMQIIVAEANGGSWLKQSWRPLTMLTFVALIVFHWLGWTDTDLSEDQVLALLEIVKIGLGGYVVSRGVEKTAQTLAPALAARK